MMMMIMMMMMIAALTTVWQMEMKKKDQTIAEERNQRLRMESVVNGQQWEMQTFYMSQASRSALVYFFLSQFWRIIFGC